MNQPRHLGVNLSRPPALHVSRTPVPYPLPTEQLATINTGIPMPSDSPAVNMGMLLPINDRVLPTFPNLGLGLETPFYPHPAVDLLIPLRSLYHQWAKNELGVVLFLTPSDIGLPYSASIGTRAALRYIASVGDRTQLITNLATVRTSIDLLMNNIPAQQRIARAMRMPTAIENKILSELSSGKVLFSPMCVEWLLAEAVAAHPSPWGLLPKIDGSDDLEKSFFPSLAYGYPPSESQDFRAIFFAQQGFFHDERSLSNSTTNSLLTEISAGILEMSDLDPLHHISVSAHIWRARSSGTSGYEWRQSMLDTFRDVTGLTYRRFLGLIMLACFDIMSLTAEFYNPSIKSPRADILKYFKAYLPEDLELLRSLINNNMSSSLSDLQRVLRGDRHYQGFGHLHPRVLANVDIPPLLEANGRYLVLGLGRLVRSARTVILDVLREAQHTDPRGLYGKHCFEITILEIASQLEPRHRIASGNDIEAILGKSHTKPDLLIVHDRYALVIEVYANSIDGTVRGGNRTAIIGRHSRYRGKLKQALSIGDNVSTVTGELFNWSTVVKTVNLVVVEDMSPNNPVLDVVLKERGHKQNKIACSIDEFLRLVGLGYRGWSVPRLVMTWQNGSQNGPLGSYLQHQESISSTAPWLRDYQAESLADLFA